MNIVLSIFIIAALVEGVWEILKPLWPRFLFKLERERGVPVDRLGVVLISLAACFAASFDLPSAAGVSFELPILTTILTGILTGRMANFWHDLMGVADGFRRDKKPLDFHAGL